LLAVDDPLVLETFPIGTVSLAMKLDVDPVLPGGRYTAGLVATATVGLATAEALLYHAYVTM